MSAVPKTSAAPPVTAAVPPAASTVGGVVGPIRAPETHHKCSGCERTKPRTEFYSSEKKKSKRCKQCHCARVYRQNKNNGRRSTSFSAAQIQWLDTVIRALPCSSLRDYAQRKAYGEISRKMANMAKGRE